MELASGVTAYCQAASHALRDGPHSALDCSMNIFLVGRIMTLGLFRLAGYILSLDEVSVQHLDTCCWTVTQKKVVLAVRVASFHVYCSMTVLGTQHAMRRPISRYSVKLFY